MLLAPNTPLERTNDRSCVGNRTSAPLSATVSAVSRVSGEGPVAAQLHLGPLEARHPGQGGQVDGPAGHLEPERGQPCRKHNARLDGVDRDT